MDAVIVKVTYDRKTKTRLCEEITGTKAISDTFDKQFCSILIKRLIDAKVIGGTYTLEETIVQSDVA